MKTRTQRLALYGSFLLLALILGRYLSDSIQFADAAETDAQGPAACLSCHGGSFDKLAAKKAAFKYADSATVNPHQYVPHNEKKPENVPDCTNCHSPHPIPPKGKIDLSKVDVDNCFLSCHHQQNFERCDACHHK